MVLQQQAVSYYDDPDIEESTLFTRAFDRNHQRFLEEDAPPALSIWDVSRVPDNFLPWLAETLNSYIYPQATYDLGAYTYPTRTQKEQIVRTAFRFWAYHGNRRYLFDLFGQILNATITSTFEASIDDPPVLTVEATIHFTEILDLPQDFQAYCYWSLKGCLPFNFKLGRLTLIPPTGRPWTVEWSDDFGPVFE